MVFIDCRLFERKGGKPSKTKVSAKETDLLKDIVRRAIEKLLKRETQVEQLDPADLDLAIKRIKNVSCNEYALIEFLNDPDASIKELNSEDRDIFWKGLDIEFTLLESEASSPPSQETGNGRAHEEGCIEYGLCEC